jgi:MFS family permease
MTADLQQTYIRPAWLIIGPAIAPTICAARLISGIFGAFGFIAGGALASNIAQAQPQRQAFYLSLFYVGPAVGILISGFFTHKIRNNHFPDAEAQSGTVR